MTFGNENLIVEQGEHPEARGGRAAVSTQSSFSTRAALKVLAAGGNAMDAAVAASLVDGVTSCLLTNHAGSVVGLFWHAASKTLTELNSTGVFPSDVGVCTPLPDVGHPLTSQSRLACCIPGFMPGLGAIHERFGSKPWGELCRDAIEWAETGFPMSSYNYGLHVRFLPITSYFPAGRRLFLPDGTVPTVGMRFRNPELARTLRRLASNGWKEFTEGEWARLFVEQANAIGWNIERRHLLQAQPRWCEPLRYRYGDAEIAQLSPPQTHGIVASLTLAVMRELGVAEAAPASAQRLFYMAHTLRWANRDSDYINDPASFATDARHWMSGEYAQAVARIVRGARPSVDLSSHARLLLPTHEFEAAGLGAVPPNRGISPPCGSCELSIVDEQGNWVQMLNTMQTGGIPGAVVGGVPMLGSHATFGTLTGKFSSWAIPGCRPRFIVGSTLVLKNGKPVLGLGASGTPVFHVPQVLTSILGAKLDPAAAIRAPRLLAPIADDNSLTLEDRIAESALRDLLAQGVRPRLARPFDLDAGWFQCCWREGESGALNAYSDPRGNGEAAVLA